MVSESNQTPPENVDGVIPVDFPVLAESTIDALDVHESKLNAISMEMESLVNIIQLVETDPNSSMLKYALEKYGLDTVISSEQVGDTAQQVWDRMKLNLQRYQSDLFSYAKVIQSGAESAVERLTMLQAMADNIKHDPIKLSITLRVNKKYGINGVFTPKDIRPMLNQTQNLFDFYDKVLVSYMRDVDKVILGTRFDDPSKTGDINVAFEKYSAKRWMNGLIDVTDDERFRKTEGVVRSTIAQGDKAIYFAGPVDAPIDDEVKEATGWSKTVSTVRNFKLKYYTVPGMHPLNEEDNKIKVEASNAIKQRLNYIVGVAKRIQSRIGYDKTISTTLRKLENSAEKLRSQVRGIRPNEDQNTEESVPLNAPSMESIAKDLVAIMNSMTRLATDYNNGIAAQLRLVGALGYVADLELKAYEAPLKKPTEAVKEKIKE